jgi:thiol-disulfide isomerase/thioredoxin
VYKELRVVDLPADFLSTPFGHAMRPFIENMFGPSKHLSAPTRPEGLVDVMHAGALDDILAKHPAVILYFTSPGCPPCHVIKPIYQRMIQEQQPGHDCIVGTVIDSVHPQTSSLFTRYDIHGTPTFVFLHNGSQVDKVVGANQSKMTAAFQQLKQSLLPRMSYSVK